MPDITVTPNKGIGTTFFRGQKHKFRILGTNLNQVESVRIAETKAEAIGKFQWSPFIFVRGDASKPGYFSVSDDGKELKFFSKLIPNRDGSPPRDDGDGTLNINLTPITGSTVTSPEPVIPSNYAGPMSPGPVKEEHTSSSRKVITINIR